MGAGLSLDLFCRVVDNYGDIGVCWRFARQLAAEHPIKLRLIVDDFTVFKKIEPTLDQNKAQQFISGVEILRWDEAVLGQHYDAPADAVIEAFACNLPEMVVAKMRATKPVWIDFEYLTAEDWTFACQARPSLHPATGLDKSLFFPGFDQQTGGLIRERDVIAKRDAFQSNPITQNKWRAQHGLPEKREGMIDVSLFCYPTAPVMALQNVRLFVPEGLAPELSGPHIHRFSFLTHPDYDRLLWTCDLNFVRGEDSWVRAIWAGKPFVWQIYKQDDNAHLAKLKAFLDIYLKGLTPAQAEVLADFHAMWNEEGREDRAVSGVWDTVLPLLPEFKRHALSWSAGQAAEIDCATNLINFIRAQKHKLKTTG